MDPNRVGFSVNRKPPAPAEKTFERAVDELVYMRGCAIAGTQIEKGPTVDSRAVALQARMQIQDELAQLSITPDLLEELS